MNATEDFDRRIAQIHGLSELASGPRTEVPVDTRHAEFEAMALAFLGQDYDGQKLSRVEDLQIRLQKRQAGLVQQLQEAKIGPGKDVDAVNTAIRETFEKIEGILGSEDFLRFFGAPIEEVAGYVDKETFLREHQAGQTPSPHEVAVDLSRCHSSYANLVRMTATPEEVILDFVFAVQDRYATARPSRADQRIVLNFFNAKRLMAALTVALQRHEATFGRIENLPARPAEMAGAAHG